MRFTVLGCHSPYPPFGGAGPGYLLELEGKKILIDCGSGVLAQLAKYFPPYELDGVILSHLHHDHICDFFILQYAVTVPKNRRSVPLPVWAPAEPADWFEKLAYKNAFQLHLIEEGMSVMIGSQGRITFYRTDHGVPCYAMKMEDGKHTILYGADSGPDTDWLRMAKAPDLFICEATYPERLRPAQPNGHLSAKQAGQAAKQIEAKQLWLTHLYPEIEPGELEEEAKQEFVHTLTCYSHLSVSFSQEKV
jgi:ribonuclease BN (tRNA processing enzyme)